MNIVLYYIPVFIIVQIVLMFSFLFFYLKYTRTILYFLNEHNYITLEFFDQLKSYIENFGVIPFQGQSSDAVTAIDKLWKIFRKSYIPKKFKKIHIIQRLYRFIYTMIIFHLSIFILFFGIFIFFIIYSQVKKG